MSFSSLKTNTLHLQELTHDKVILSPKKIANAIRQNKIIDEELLS